MKTEQIIEEREDSVKMKMRFKRFLSGFKMCIRDRDYKGKIPRNP